MQSEKHIPLKLYQKGTIKVGQAPGTLTRLVQEAPTPVVIKLFDYDQNNHEERPIETIAELGQLKNKSTNSWINVDGISDPNVVAELGEIFGIHALVLEDILNPSQRIKLEQYDDYLFIVLKMITYSEESDSFDKENVSLILGRQFLISFQEKPGDVFEVIRQRIRKEESRMRQSSCDYLAYRLIDSIVDNYYIVLEKYGERIEKLEKVLSKRSDPAMLNEIQVLKRELLLFLRAVMPLSEVLSDMMMEHIDVIADETRVFLRDVHDHFVYIKDTIVSFRELADSIQDGYMSIISYKMNEVMQVLTIFAAIFIPLTFIAGVYGMNFEFMPELKMQWSYPLVWFVMIAVVVSMLFYFKRKKWF